MSLINKMLRDLDQRQASVAERAGLSGQVRALPPERRFPWRPLLLTLSGVMLGAVGVWAWLQSQPSRHAEQAAPVPPPAPVVMAMPPLVVPMPGETVSPVKVESLHLDPGLRVVPPMPVPAVKPEAEAAVSAQAPAAPVPAASIDKQPRAPVAGGTADDEYRLALVAFRQGRSNEALMGFEAALRAEPRHIAARQALLSLLMEQRRWAEAQAVVAEGLTLNAAQPGWAMILARLQVEQGQVAEAQETMARHAVHGERSPDYLAFHGLLLEKLGRNEEARAAFLRARDLGSLSPELAAAVDQHLR